MVRKFFLERCEMTDELDVLWRVLYSLGMLGLIILYMVY